MNAFDQIRSLAGEVLNERSKHRQLTHELVKLKEFLQSLENHPMVAWEIQQCIKGTNKNLTQQLEWYGVDLSEYDCV